MKKFILLFTVLLGLGLSAPAGLTAQPTDSLTEVVTEPTGEPDSIIPTAPAEGETVTQITEGGDDVTLEQLTKWAIPIGVAANWIITYLLGLFPNFVLFKNDRWRDLSVKSLAVAAVVGFVLWKFGLAGTADVIIAFVLSSFGYDKILNPMGLKTKTAAPAQA